MERKRTYISPCRAIAGIGGRRKGYYKRLVEKDDGGIVEEVEDSLVVVDEVLEYRVERVVESRRKKVSFIAPGKIF